MQPVSTGLVQQPAQDQLKLVSPDMRHGMLHGLRHGMRHDMLHGMHHGMYHDMLHGMHHGMYQGMPCIDDC